MAKPDDSQLLITPEDAKRGSSFQQRVLSADEHTQKMTALGSALGCTDKAPNPSSPPEPDTLGDHLLTLRDKLRSPLPKEAIKPHPTKKWMSSINGAFIVERLNDCFGESGWRAKYEVIEGKPDTKMVVIKATFEASGGIYREAFGGNDNPDRGDAYKGACTDALGKIASQIGIAGEVYKGMLDEVQSVPDTSKKSDKKKYEAVQGRVTELRNISPNLVYLQINSNGLWIRTSQVAHADQLRNSLGCRVELTAFWDKGKVKGDANAQDLMTISAVHGVFEAKPRTEYIRKGPDEDEHLSPDMKGL